MRYGRLARLEQALGDQQRKVEELRGGGCAEERNGGFGAGSDRTRGRGEGARCNSAKVALEMRESDGDAQIVCG